MKYVLLSCMVVFVSCVGCSNSSKGQRTNIDSGCTPTYRISMLQKDSVPETKSITDKSLTPFKYVVDTLNSASDHHVHSEYFLYDINRDGKPELWVKSGTCEADMNLWVYSVDHGTVKKILSTDGGHIDFFIRNDTIMSVTCNCGGGYVSIYNYKNGEITVKSAEFSMWNEEGQAKAINKKEQSIINMWDENCTYINLNPLK